jgi:hypothetical protein
VKKKKTHAPPPSPPSTFYFFFKSVKKTMPSSPFKKLTKINKTFTKYKSNKK